MENSLIEGVQWLQYLKDISTKMVEPKMKRVVKQTSVMKFLPHCVDVIECLLDGNKG